MRYLNKIIFINSAHIKYAEINLDGNVHFIGTQGVGKSTLLRAILFFYNADTMGLGIPRQKKTYTDYYFQNTNSYIIYEVVRSEGKFCIISYKSQHKVCFRIFDGEYNKNYFISESGHVPDNWESIAQQLDANRIFYTKKKIEEHTEYRDILYGNNDGKKNELKRYSILESKDYQYIPKTIQNVFLNSKMDAEFIKQTIIMSLENDVRIDLNQYAHHLNDFETQFVDIKKFKAPATTLQTNSIAKLYIAIKQLEKEKVQSAKELVWALQKTEEEEPELIDRLQKQKDAEHIDRVKLTKASDSFREKENKIRGEISVLENKLKEIKRLTDEYAKQNISQIIERVKAKNAIEKEQKNAIEEKDLLSVQFRELSQKFNALFNRLDNQWNEFFNDKSAEKNTINSGFMAFKDEIAKVYTKKIAGIRAEYKSEIDTVKILWEHKKEATNKLKIEREGARHKRFFEAEIRQSEVDIQALTMSIQKLVSDNKNATREIETLQKHWQLDENELQKTKERIEEKLTEQIVAANKKITEIDSYLLNSKTSLYGWLSDHYTGWENTIGKVIDEKNVLFHTSLSPKLSEPSNTFYGVQLDLEEISKNVTSVADYETEKEEWTEKINAIKTELSAQAKKTEKEKENLKQKYQPKIREKKDSKKENEYLAQQKETRLAEAKVQKNTLLANAETEKKKQLALIELAIAEATNIELDTKNDIEKKEEELTKLIKAQEKNQQNKVEKEAENINRIFIKIESEINIEKNNNQKRKNEINAQKDSELSKKGADTKRLAEIEETLYRLKTELGFIEANSALVARYEYDKEQLFNKTDEFKNRKQALQRQLENEENNYNLNIEKINKNLALVRNVIEIISRKLIEIKDDKDAFASFKDSDVYNTISEHFINPDEENKTQKRVTLLIENIKEIHYEKLNKRTEELRKTIIDFRGKFSDNNVFKFTRQLSDNVSFLEFAFMLTDFIEEKKIEKIEREVNERFAFIITTIGKETNGLIARSGDIQKVIRKINDDFIEKNFAGVIKKIELKVEDSKNEIVQLLILIRKYNDDNSFELGERNLFSSGDHEKKNKEAIDLLKQFVKKINDLKRDFISLSDSFELKFRIEENQNDTGWVEKLSNVGSDGTDVLVKAMVNIMLLNVFKESASKRFKDFRLHCMMDEIGKLHPNNVRGILKFANDRNILLINSSPIENDALAFKHIYKLKKDEKSITRVNRILTQLSEI